MCHKKNLIWKLQKLFRSISTWKWNKQSRKNEIDADSLKKYHEEFLKSNKLILKTQQRFKSETRNVFPKEINKIAWSSNDDKIMQSIDSIETYACGTSKGLVSEKEKIKCDNIIKQYKND